VADAPSRTACAGALLLAAVLVAGCASDVKQVRERSIVLISIDTLRADHLGCYGYFRDTSPVIDALAKQSVFFEMCLTPMATTLPAHASLLTGTYPIEHGVLGNLRRGAERFTTGVALRSFAQFARDRGYRTAAFVSAVPLSSGTGIDAGFEHFDEPAERERLAGETNARVLPWIDELRGEPFFLWVHYFDPHHRFEPPRPYDEEFATDSELESYIKSRNIADRVPRQGGVEGDTREWTNGYDGEIRYVDHELGVLFERLRQRGLWDEVAIVLTSDHGEGIGDHAMAGHGYIHREQLHVPLMMRIPGVPPKRVRETISLVDALPTLVGLVDDAGWSGFVDQATGRDVLADDFTPGPIFGQRSGWGRSDLWGPAYSLTTDRWKYVHEPQRGDRLFDWSKDPYELTDVLAEHGEIGDSLKTQLLERIGQYERSVRIAPDERQDEVVDPEMLEQLRALGYGD